MRISDWSSDVCSSDLNAHQCDRDQKGVFTPQPVAQKTEHDRSQRTEAESDRETGPDQQNLQGFVVAGEECRADQAEQRAIDEEVIPFEDRARRTRSEEHTSELQSLMRNSYAVFCLKKTKKTTEIPNSNM